MSNRLRLRLPSNKTEQLSAMATQGHQILRPVEMLELWGDHADIRSLTKDTLYGSSASNILGGYRETPTKA